jgi:hypothetical protein
VRAQELKSGWRRGTPVDSDVSRGSFVCGLAPNRLYYRFRLTTSCSIWSVVVITREFA